MTSADGSNTQGADVNQKMNVVCKSWDVEVAQITLPSNINSMNIDGATVPKDVLISSRAVNMKGGAYQFSFIKIISKKSYSGFLLSEIFILTGNRFMEKRF